MEKHQETSSRLDRLERENRTLRRRMTGMVVLILALPLAAFFYQDKKQDLRCDRLFAKRVYAHGIVLVDKNEDMARVARTGKGGTALLALQDHRAALASGLTSVARVAGTYVIDLEKTINPIITATPGADKMTPAQRSQMMDMMKSMFKGASLTLNKDLSFVGSTTTPTGKSASKGTWTITEGKITFHQTHQDGKEKKETVAASVTGDVISVESGQGGKKVKLFFKKNAK